MSSNIKCNICGKEIKEGYFLDEGEKYICKDCYYNAIEKANKILKEEVKKKDEELRENEEMIKGFFDYGEDRVRAGIDGDLCIFYIKLPNGKEISFDLREFMNAFINILLKVWYMDKGVELND